MDTSEQYILMCEKAEEIQDFTWRERPGDFVSGRKTPDVGKAILVCQLTYPMLTCPRCGNEEKPIHWIDYFWLPHQDQLQEMLSSGLWSKSLAFEYFLRTEKTYNINLYAFQFTSMEQLWLAFVMKENYNKAWDGKEWMSG